MLHFPTRTAHRNRSSTLHSLSLCTLNSLLFSLSLLLRSPSQLPISAHPWPQPPPPPSLLLPGPIPSPHGLPPPDLFLHARSNVSGIGNPALVGAGRGVAGSAKRIVRVTALLGTLSSVLFGLVGHLAAHVAQGGGVSTTSLAPVVQKTIKSIQHNHGPVGDVARIIGGRSVSDTCTSGVSLMCCDVDSAGNLGGACTLPIPGEEACALSQALCCDSDDPSFDFQCHIPATPLTDDDSANQPIPGHSPLFSPSPWTYSRSAGSPSPLSFFHDGDPDDEDPDGDLDDLKDLNNLTKPAVMGVGNPLLTGAGRGIAGSAKGIVVANQLLGTLSSVLFGLLGRLAAHVAQGGGVAVANLAPVVQKTIKRIQHNHGPVGDVARVIGGRSVSYTCTSGVSLMCCNVDSAGNLGEACMLPIPGEACVAPSQAQLCCDSDDPSFDFQCIAPTPLTDVE
ncbi:hypothetical protein BDP27DRAFT_1422800 [Rhodocollybia butyracea]|uniref:Hydrophobin n=1 Tax=Rhodocollybia butyracea TaxID=206335 RepID=A0A9P5PKW5_9AGAR|nr:hypothetical protein BDP27DRAFT_1422800 [Rhodocollybia butyracea]